MHRINARAEKKVTAGLINAFKKVTDKENILFSIAEASLAAPEETVRRVVYPAIAGALLGDLSPNPRRRKAAFLLPTNAFRVLWWPADPTHTDRGASRRRAT